MFRYLTNLTRYLFFTAAVACSCAGGDEQPNRRPQIGSLNSPVQANENELYTIDIPVSDPDGDPVSLRVINPSGVRFHGNRLEWTPGDYQVGRQTVEIEASDGRGGFDNEFLVVDVLDDFSDNPVIGSNPIAQAIEGRKYVYKINAHDPDTGQTSTLKYTLGSSTDKAVINNGLHINSTTGLIEWDNPNLGTYRIEIEVEDTTGRKAIQSLDLKVVEPRYALSGKIVDLDGKPLQNISVAIKGIGATTTDIAGSYKISNLLAGNYAIEVADPTKIYTRRHNIRISQDTTEDIQTIKIGGVASTSTKYLDSTGTPDFLVFFGHIARTQTNTRTQRWASLAVPIFLNADNNPTSAEQAAPGKDNDRNGVNDLVDFVRQSIASWEKESGLDLFTEGPTPVGWDDTTLTQYSPGIFMNYPQSPSGGGDLSVSSPTNTTQIGEIEVSSSLPDGLFKTNILRALGFSLGLETTEGHSFYLLIDGPISPTITKPHQDEVETLRALYRLHQDTDMNEFEGR